MDKQLTAILQDASLQDDTKAMVRLLSMQPHTMAELRFKLKIDGGARHRPHAFDALIERGLVEKSFQRRRCAVTGKPAAEWRLTPEGKQPKKIKVVVAEKPPVHVIRKCAEFYDALYRAASAGARLPKYPPEFDQFNAWLAGGAPDRRAPKGVQS